MWQDYFTYLIGAGVLIYIICRIVRWWRAPTANESGCCGCSSYPSSRKGQKERKIKAPPKLLTRSDDKE
ncbi:hypothetical protein PORCRE_1470 [Porphyromonas crevioricanis JCM 15906]|uniref:FeoB-associated Cys-rich membrane protein n=1 Tax=Porphyromonas crevioricanis JCM 15906 TaxID=1305617 RepID=T1CPK9_9PORP|nr:hypothetical protein [Porphyromonas crevioricanis]GAD05762.1 hypothetical protein PORCRE_1470 [Porphyromonas crevioricanis JCM 15906]